MPNSRLHRVAAKGRIGIRPRAGRLILAAWLATGALVSGCRSAGQAPPFEWWVEPLPNPPPASMRLDGIVPIAVLVEHTGRRDDFKAFQRDLRRYNDRVKRGDIPGFRLECHYLPKLGDRVRSELNSGLGGSGWFAPVKPRAVNKALKASRARWLDLRNPAVAAQVGRLCEARLVLLVEIIDCKMNVTEARQQTVGAKKIGPQRRTDVAVKYDIRAVDVESGRVSWQSELSRRAGYKLEGPGSLGHWYKRRDPLEFRLAMRGQSITDFVLRAFLENEGRDKESSGGSREPWKTYQ